MGNPSITLPLAPSVNHAYSIRNSRMFKTKTAKDWQEAAALVAKKEADKHEWFFPVRPDFGDFWVVIEVYYYFPDKRRRDVHNMHKLLPDALEGVVYDDDRWALIRDMGVEIDRENPRMEITWYRE